MRRDGGEMGWWQVRRDGAEMGWWQVRRDGGEAGWHGSMLTTMSMEPWWTGPAG